MHYTLEIEIDKPRNDVANLFGSPENLAYWQPGFIRIDPLSENQGEAGSTSNLIYKNRGRDVILKETIIVANLPDEFSATFEAKGMFMTVKNYFSEIDPDTTRWVSENEVKVSGLMMRVITIVMPGCFKKESYKYMKNFKAFAEKGTDIRNASRE